jgi:hypothetical protein
MNIKFEGHQKTEREVEVSQQQLFNLFEMMRAEFLEHITYARFNNSYPSQVEKDIVSFCNSYGVDPNYPKDRVAFFRALLSEIPNPYQ